MTIPELQAIVAGGENERVEFKTTTGQRTEGVRSVCAMLNGRGGFVLFGVSDDGDIRGQEVAPRTLEQLLHELRRIEPAPLLSPEQVEVAQGRSVLAVAVPGGSEAVYVFDGRPYLRQGPTTVPMPQDEYRRRLLEHMHPLHRWENQPAQGITVADLDHAEITRTVDEAIRRGRLDEPGTRDPSELLTGLGLLVNGRLLNAAAALFLQESHVVPYYPQLLLRMARFRGREKDGLADIRQANGNLFTLLSAAQRFLREHLPVAGRITPGLFERADDPVYPPEALREALANAFAHRDYVNPGGSVGVGIFDDRLEITSSGGLHFGLTPADLAGPHTSMPWNPNIARVLFRRGVIEQWGRGTIKIADLTRQAGLRAPEFEERGGELLVRFYRAPYQPPARVAHELTPLQQEIMRALAQLGPVPSHRIAPLLTNPVSDYTLLSNLHALRHLRLVEKSGKTRGARWRLTGRE